MKSPECLKTMSQQHQSLQILPNQSLARNALLIQSPVLPRNYSQGKRRRPRSAAFVKEDLLRPLYSSEISILAPPDEDSVLHLGVPEVLLDRISTGDWKGCYECVYYDFASDLGLPTEERACRHQASNKVGMSTHLRKCHLGCAFECPFCQKSTRFWDGSNWLKHLRSKHSFVPTAQWYTKKVTKADDE